MAAAPGVTLTATLQDSSGSADAGSSLRITLCGFGMILPGIVGTSKLAKISQRITSANGMFSVPLWGNYQITPGNTFYEIAVLDEDNNVVQAGMYSFPPGGPFDLSNLNQLTVGVPYLTGAVPNGPIPGSNFELPTAAVGGDFAAAVYYNGMLQGVEWYTVAGRALLLAFALQAGDSLWLEYATTNFGSGPPLRPWLAMANGVYPGTAYTLPTPPPGAQFAGVFYTGGFQNPSQYTLAGQSLVMNFSTQRGDKLVVKYLIGATPRIVATTLSGVNPGTVFDIVGLSPSGAIEALYLNELFQRPGIDYSATIGTITMKVPTQAGDILYAFYPTLSV